MKVINVTALLIFSLLSVAVLANFGLFDVYFLAPSIKCTPPSFYKVIGNGSNDTQIITVEHVGSGYPPGGYNATFSKSSGVPGDWMTFIDNVTIFVPESPSFNQTTINISVPENQSGGNYSGFIFANASNLTIGNCTIPFTINVTTPAPPPPPPPPTVGVGVGVGIVGALVLDTGITLEQDEVEPGQRIYATITILKAGGPSGIVNVNVTYFLVSPEGNVVDTKFATVGIETIRSDIYFLRIPSNAPPGTYIFKAIVRYDTSFDEAQGTFLVVRELPPEELEITIDSPIFFVGVKDFVNTQIMSITERTLIVNITLAPPRGLIIERDSLVIRLEPQEEVVLFWPVTPTRFGIFEAHLIIKYDSRTSVEEFTISVLPSYLQLAIAILITILILFLLILSRRRREREERGLRIRHLKRVVTR